MVIRRKALLICSPQLGLAPNSILGGEVFDRQILLGLAKKGIKIEIILPKNKPHDQNIKNWRLTYIWLSHFPAPLANLIVLPYLYIVFAKRRFEIIRIHQPQFLGLSCLFFKFFHPSIKLVATYHQFGESSFGPFSKLVNSLWDHIICDSLNVKELLIEHFSLPPTKITVVHNGVPSYLKPAKKDKNLLKSLKLEGKVTLLFMGLFIERKNPLFLLDVLANLVKERENLALIFWGEGPLESKIRVRTQELGIGDKIRIQKPVFGKEKNKIHNLADIFVHPALDEGFALTPLEAMACAKPVVMTQGYSAKEVVEDNITGYLCHSNDTNHWCKKLNKLIANPSLRERMGQAAFLKVQKEFQWDLAVDKHLEALKTLAHK